MSDKKNKIIVALVVKILYLLLNNRVSESLDLFDKFRTKKVRSKIEFDNEYREMENNAAKSLLKGEVSYALELAEQYYKSKLEIEEVKNTIVNPNRFLLHSFSFY